MKYRIKTVFPDEMAEFRRCEFFITPEYLIRLETGIFDFNIFIYSVPAVADKNNRDYIEISFNGFLLFI